MQRRQFLLFSLTAAAGAAAQRGDAAAALKFGHRQANMVNDPGPAVFDLAKQIHGLSGVELQVYFKGTTLCDQATLAAYQRAAERTGLTIPSLAGVWPPGATLLQPTAEENLRNAIHAAESVHATTILAACFEQNCPKMEQEQSYGPVVALLQNGPGDGLSCSSQIHRRHRQKEPFCDAPRCVITQPFGRACQPQRYMVRSGEF